jgi:hypothetical protein
VTKTRILVFLLTVIVVGLLGAFTISYARGYRIDWKHLKLSPNGLLVVKSEPTGAQIFVNGDLKTASDATISLSPGTYDVSVRRDGYFAWNKRLTIEKEEVTLANVSLFRVAPSLTAVTFDGAVNPVVAGDLSRIAFAVPPSTQPGSSQRAGLWVIDTTELPLGFSRDPRRIADGDLTQATWEFSPDGRQLMLTTQAGAFTLDTGSFTAQSTWVNIGSRKVTILADWQNQTKNKLAAQTRNLPEEVVDLTSRKVKTVAFSPDETKILYTASAAATLSENLVKPLPGSSTQKQERNIEEGKTYVYDIKEDRNFLISDEDAVLRWLPTSKHLILAGAGRVEIMDYDGTNRQPVYSGSYSAPFAFPYANSSRLLILTDLGSGATTNLYSLSLK